MPPMLHAIAFMAGHFAVHQLARLPDPAVWAACALGALLALAIRVWAEAAHSRSIIRRASPMVALAAWLLIGLCAAGWRAQMALDQRLSPALEDRDLSLEGEIVGLPQLSDTHRRLRVRPLHGMDPETQRPIPMPGEVALYWNLKPLQSWPADPQPGEVWRFTVRLRAPHSLANPDLFDAELRALEDGVGATGSVRSGLRLASGPRSWRGAVDGWREQLRQAMRHAAGVSQRSVDAAEKSELDQRSRAAAILIALAVGDQNAIPASDWLLFQRTGVSHLMSISGMHVTMLAALGGWAMRVALGWPWLAACVFRRLSRRTAVRLAAVLTAFGYAQLAGWGLPAQRTFWMLAAAALAGSTGRSRATADVLAVAAAVVVALDPWAVMSTGFWLSFCAVATLIWAGQSLPTLPTARERTQDSRARAAQSWFARLRPTLHAGAVAQAAATIALAPLSVWFFSSFSVVGPLANLVAIPVVTFLITPAALVGAALALGSDALAAAVLVPAVWLTERLLDLLGPMATWPLATVVMAQPSMSLLLLAALGGGWLFAPRAVPARWVGALMLLPAMAVPRERPAPGVVWLTAYDVGQGSALLLETATQTLLYDTGPRMGPEMDAGARVLLPSLRARGIDRLDKLVISHADEDHIGGAQTLLRELKVTETLASLPPDHPLRPNTRACHQGQAWEVDGVHFEVLHPTDPPAPKPARSAGSPTNAMSCVLAVTAPGGRVLLTGDLEAPQERELVERLGPASLRSDVLIVPHHGSKTSSSPEFLAAVAPRQAIFQLGWRNHYRHPHPGVLQRYEQAAIPILRTDRDGAIQIALSAGVAPKISRFRVDEARYWRVAEPWRASDRLPSEASRD